MKRPEPLPWWVPTGKGSGEEGVTASTRTIVESNAPAIELLKKPLRPSSLISRQAPGSLEATTTRASVSGTPSPLKRSMGASPKKAKTAASGEMPLRFCSEKKEAVGSGAQIPEQPSPPLLLPSSHCSPTCRTPSPQTSVKQLEEAEQSGSKQSTWLSPSLSRPSAQWAISRVAQLGSAEQSG